MAHLHVVPAPVDYDAEATRLKQEILSRGGVRVDREKARKRLAEIEAELCVVQEDDGEVA